MNVSFQFVGTVVEYDFSDSDDNVQGVFFNCCSFPVYVGSS